MWDNPEMGEVLLAGTVVLAVAGVVCFLLLRMTAPPQRSRYSHSLESRLQGVVGGRMRELELKPYAELAALPATQREDKLSPSGRRFYIQTTKARQTDGTLAVTVQVGEVKWLRRGVRVSETLYASPPAATKAPC